MRSDKQERHDRLCGLILKAVADNGQEKDGQIWALKPMTEWEKLMGLTRRSIHDLIKIEPIQTLGTGAYEDDGSFRRIVALRVGEVGSTVEKTKRHLANIMAKIFREKTGKSVHRKSYGCLIGLAEIWPEGHQVAIFKDMLHNWGSFMVAAKFRINIDQNVLGIEGLKQRYYRFPIIGLLRRYPYVAQDAFLTHLQIGSGGKAILPFPYHYTDH
ncbi:hypothetical protein [Cypionkella sinensis]|uniref:LAGLIDADG homing endonuclease n=2 Tax=Cypionkella sinensis TaxID=1756043 RepID=A0ABV7J565_9RHOB